MGCFDTVNFTMLCPKCRGRTGVFQTKDGPCMFNTLPPDYLINMWGSCDNCAVLIDFQRQLDNGSWKVTIGKSSWYVQDVWKIDGAQVLG